MSAQAPTLYTFVRPVLPNSNSDIFFHFAVMDPCNMDFRVVSITREANVITVVVGQEFVGPSPSLPEGFYCLSPPPDGIQRVLLGSLPAGTYIARVDHWHPAYDQAVAFSVSQAPIPVPLGNPAWGGLAALLLFAAAKRRSATRRAA